MDAEHHQAASFLSGDAGLIAARQEPLDVLLTELYGPSFDHAVDSPDEPVVIQLVVRLDEQLVVALPELNGNLRRLEFLGVVEHRHLLAIQINNRPIVQTKAQRCLPVGSTGQRGANVNGMIRQRIGRSLLKKTFQPEPSVFVREVVDRVFLSSQCNCVWPVRLRKLPHRFVGWFLEGIEVAAVTERADGLPFFRTDYRWRFRVGNFVEIGDRFVIIRPGG